MDFPLNAEGHRALRATIRAVRDYGGYSLIFTTADGGTLCAPCARGEYWEVASARWTNDTASGFLIQEAFSAAWVTESLQCDLCHSELAQYLAVEVKPLGPEVFEVSSGGTYGRALLRRGAMGKLRPASEAVGGWIEGDLLDLLLSVGDELRENTLGEIVDAANGWGASDED